MYNYKVYKSAGKVVAISTFAGKAVRGIAKCDPTDTYSETFGEDLAIARCSAKIAHKRVKSATTKMNAAAKALEAAQKHYEQMVAYYSDAIQKQHDAEATTEALLNTLAR